MTLSKCANSLGLQVNNVLAREFPHKGDSGFNIELLGNKGEASWSLVKFLCLVPPTPPCGCQAQGFNSSKMK
jgi:hypothetical protein